MKKQIDGCQMIDGAEYTRAFNISQPDILFIIARQDFEIIKFV